LTFVVLSDVTLAAELVLKPNSDPQIRALGTSIVFTCEVDDVNQDKVSDLDIKWFDNKGREVTDKAGNRIYIEEDESSKKLYVTGIETSDEGQYKCSALIEGKRQQKTVNLVQFQDITFKHAPVSQNPIIYSRAVIECVVSGTPKPTVSWRYNGTRISKDKKYEINERGLLISNVTRADDGVYTCRAEVESEGRYDEKKITVNIHIPPHITKGPLPQIDGVEGEQVSIQCEATGLPAPKYEFLKDGSETPIGGADRIEVDPDLGTLVFKPVRHEDTGRYTCKAKNSAGTNTSVGALRVLVRPKIFSLNHIVETEGKGVTLLCESHGVPAPLMFFQKTGQDVEYRPGSYEDGRITVSNQRAGRLELVVRSLIPADAGNYTCKARNDVGYNESVATITVNFRPVFAKSHQTVAYIWPGKTSNITCNVLAEPPATMKWMKGNQDLAKSDNIFHIFHMGNNNSLQVRMTETEQMYIYDKYTCEASNELGKTVSVIELKRAVAPDYALNITVSDLEPDKVVLHVGGSRDREVLPVIGYRVEFLGRTPELQKKIFEFHNGNTLELENLQANTNYTLLVSAKNEVGAGNATRRSLVTAPVRKPYPMKISSPRVGLAGYSYTLQWDKPRTGGAPIQQYEFKYKKAKSTSESAVIGPNSGKATAADELVIKTHYDDVTHAAVTFELTGLEPETSYELEGKMKNEKGWSDFSPMFHFQTSRATEAEMLQMRSSVGLTVALVLIVFLLVLAVVIDVTCFFVKRQGVTAFVCARACDTETQSDKEKVIEQGDSKDMLKQPLEEVNHEGEGFKMESEVAGEVPPPADGDIPPPATQIDEKEDLKNEIAKEEKEEKNEGLTEVAESDDIKANDLKEPESVPDVTVTDNSTADRKTDT